MSLEPHVISRYHKKSEGVRETFWLGKIDGWCKGAQVSTGTVVITCGHDHLEFLAGSRVSFFMNRFRKLGFVDYGESGLQVNSSLLNVVLHDYLLALLCSILTCN
jgi:hypothetical protein